MSKSELRIAIEGRGGQGVLTLGQILGVSLVNRFSNVTVSPSYTAEMFGGPCYCYVVASNNKGHNPFPEQLELAADLYGTMGEVLNKTVQENTKLFSAKSGRLNTTINLTCGNPNSSSNSNSQDDIELMTIKKNSKIPLNVYVYHLMASHLGLNVGEQSEALTEYFAGKEIQPYLDLIKDLSQQERMVES